jgi:hypothetical protein
VGASTEATALVLNALSLQWPQRAPIVVPRRADAEHYLAASASAGRPPAAAILSIDQTSDAEEQVSLLRWIRNQNERLRHTPVILLGGESGDAPDLGNDLFSWFLRHADMSAITDALGRALRYERWAASLDSAW